MKAPKIVAALIATMVAVALYVLAAYVLLPRLWSHHEHQPGLALRPMITYTAQNIPGDPINVGLVGSQTEVIQAMDRAGWHAADAVTVKSSIEIGESVILDRAYDGAPISNLFYQGQRQNLAFEKAVGISAKRRHHVRLWLTLQNGVEGRAVWLGAGSFDRGVGIGRYTGQITHHIGPDLDAERDLFIASLTQAAILQSVYQISGIGPTVGGRNGGGDLYFTDGEVKIGVLRPDNIQKNEAPVTLPSPPVTTAKDAVWAVFRGGLSRLGVLRWLRS